MKRSTINQLLRDAKAFIASRGFYLPPCLLVSRRLGHART